MRLPSIVLLEPEYRDYVWGGSRLRPGIGPTAEAWVVYEHNRVSSGVFVGRTLQELVLEYKDAILGRRVVTSTGLRFPLLVKLLDSAQWLSLQVHPNDEQALNLEGADQFGKTEAWHVVEAAEGARVIGGLKPGTNRKAMEEAIISGSILDLAHYVEVLAGDTIFMPAGTIHSLGPGLLMYEVQETSDLTYRVWDWGRPQIGGRVLHIDKSLAVADPASRAKVIPLPVIPDGSAVPLTRCPYFELSMIQSENNHLDLDTEGESFHALTVIEGSVNIRAGEEDLRLDKFQTTLITANTGKYMLSPISKFTMLKANVGHLNR